MSRVFKSDVLNSILVTVFLVIILGSSTIYIMNIQPLISDDIMVIKKAKVSTTLKVDVYGADGALKDSRIKEDDLLTKVFVDWMTAYFSGMYSSSDVTIVEKNDANADKTISIWSISITYAGHYSDSASGTSRKGGLMGIGTGTTAVARTNYALETKVESYADITASPTWDTATGTVSMVANIAITGSRTITEAMLGVRWIDTSSTEQVFMLAHDTFSGISVVNLDVCSITYTITLESGFTNNMGYYLRDCLTSVADGTSGLGSTYKNYVNGNSVIYAWKSSYTDSWYYSSSMASVGLTKVAVGTDNTALSRADYYVKTPVEALSPAMVIGDTTGFNIHSMIYCPTARTIKEVATYNSYTICMIRLLTGNVSVSANQAIIVNIRVDL